MLQVNEEARLDALRQLNLLDTPPSESFDRITRMASQIFGLPIAAVSLTDQDRQWFKSRVGVEHSSIPRDKAPCAAVAESSAPLLIPDLLADECYAESILAGQGVRFYAGAPLITRDGFGLGALCVLGVEPRDASSAEMSALNDLAQIVMSQIELQHAFGRVDPLSGLPNRTQFLEDLEDLGRDQPGERRLAVLVDLASSEQLNHGTHVMGSAYIDDIVKTAARSVRSTLGAARTAYHVAATQFAFLAPPGTDERSYARLLGDALEDARRATGGQFIVTTVIGVAPFTTGETPPADILRTAHSAAHDARRSQTHIMFYSSKNDRQHRRRFNLLADFRAALSRPGELRLVFQPRIELSTGRCSGAEALLRWQHPELGNVPPGEFVPIIEQTSLARPATAWVLDTALGHLIEMRGRGVDFRLSVNVSASNLEQTDFAQHVQLLLLKHRLRPDMLELEITESAVMENAGEALSQLNALAEAGIQLAIDDFGTGYSSLAYLQRLPAHVVKIDQSFVRTLVESEREQSLVRSMITLSHDLDYRVVGEGVETEATGLLLAEMGCDEAQGYFYARPMEVADFEIWYQARLLDGGGVKRAA
jgi:EAL domain-containing protein (putative c-di-GMP-specific phosphodiesterase class I)|tara:strand:- start:6359 stop:8137 length:1779 start_codon:yes stop_codon:yes gene_type:complete